MKGNDIIENKIIQLITKEGVPVVSSREIADRFGKEHKSILKSIDGENRKGQHINGIIDEIKLGGNPPEVYFINNEYLDTYNRTQKEYLLTRDGFSLLVMGFTGKEALDWKLKYIDAFNKMEQALKEQNNKMLPTTYKEALIQLLDQVEKNEKMEAERVILLPKADYHDEVLNKPDLLTTTIVAKDLGFKSATKLNSVMFLNKSFIRIQMEFGHLMQSMNGLLKTDMQTLEVINKITLNHHYNGQKRVASGLWSIIMSGVRKS